MNKQQRWKTSPINLSPAGYRETIGQLHPVAAERIRLILEQHFGTLDPKRFHADPHNLLHRLNVPVDIVGNIDFHTRNEVSQTESEARAALEREEKLDVMGRFPAEEYSGHYHSLDSYLKVYKRKYRQAKKERVYYAASAVKAWRKDDSVFQSGFDF